MMLLHSPVEWSFLIIQRSRFYYARSWCFDVKKGQQETYMAMGGGNQGFLPTGHLSKSHLTEIQGETCPTRPQPRERVVCWVGGFNQFWKVWIWLNCSNSLSLKIAEVTIIYQMNLGIHPMKNKPSIWHDVYHSLTSIYAYIGECNYVGECDYESGLYHIRVRWVNHPINGT